MNEIINISKKVINLYSEIDTRIEGLKKEININCIIDCGRCCYNEHIEMTVLEFIPLAIMLYKEKMIQDTLINLENNQKICILYSHNTININNGYCSYYQYRGLLCRLFGFSSTLNKYNKPVFTVCDIIKKNYNIIKNITNTKKIPLISEYYNKLKDIAPNLSDKLYPINTAIKLAIEKVMLINYYDKKE